MLLCGPALAVGLGGTLAKAAADGPHRVTIDVVARDFAFKLSRGSVPQGALVTFRWSLDRRDETRVRGLVLSSPFVRLALPVPPWKVAPAKFLSRIYPSFTLPTGIPLEYLTSDSALVRETANDPLYGTPATARWFTETVAAQRTVVARAAEVRLPLLFLVAGGDRLVDPDAARQLHDAATAAAREWHSYPGMEHEVLNEIRREDVYRDMHAWLESVLAGAPAAHASNG